MTKLGYGILSVCIFLAGCGGYEIEVRIYDPDRACNGYTFFESRSDKRILGVNMEGDVLWNVQVFDHLFPGEMNGFEMQNDGRMLFLQYGVPRIMDLTDYSILYEGEDVGGHHDATLTPMQTILCPTREAFEVDYDPWKPFNSLLGDVVVEVDMASNEVIWEWHLRDYVDPIEHHHESIKVVWGDGVRDWSHSNTVQFIPNYWFKGKRYDAVLLNSRHLNTFWVIDYVTGDILWSCGEHGMFGKAGPDGDLLFSHAHQVELLSNGSVMMYDNGNDRPLQSSRALELYVNPSFQLALEKWSWTEPGMYDYWGGDANKLPNGNVLLTNVEGGRIIEVTQSGDIVWEMVMKGSLGTYHTIYCCERLPYDSLPAP